MNNESIIENSNINSSEYDLTFRDYLIIIRIHIIKIILFSIIGLSWGIYHTFNIPPNYQATSTVEIREKPGANMIMDLSGNRNQNRIINEIQVVKSRAVAKEVVKVLWNSNRRNNLHIFGTRIFYPKGQRLRRVIKELLTFGLHDGSLAKPLVYTQPYDESIGNKFSDRIMRSMMVDYIGNTNIITIAFNSPNADEARRISQIIAETYVRYDGERSRENAIRSTRFLDSLVQNQQAKIEEKEKSIRDFKLKNNMYSLDGDATSIIIQLNTYEAELYNIKAEINIRKEKVEILDSKLTKEEKSLTGQLTNDINSQLISLRIEIGRLETQVLQNTNIYGKNLS